MRLDIVSTQYLGQKFNLFINPNLIAFAFKFTNKKNIMDNKFFNFFKPAFDYVDSGELFRKPFSWLYMAFAAVNAILPFYLLYVAIDSGIFKAGAKFVIAILLVGFLFWLLVVLES